MIEDGITGCSVACHLARAGCGDVILLDKGETGGAGRRTGC
jgi:glycine/D-amino acid oxidase-like deaminating enzyme